MRNVSLQQSPQFLGALTSSGIMAFAGLGDAILYPVLPVYAESLGVPIIWIGFILSINRFVRIFSNTCIANSINRLGMKKMLLIASFLAVITTVFYGLKLGLVSFIIARIIWGISYSGLKISALNYASIVKKNRGFVFGLTKSIKSLGALFVLWAGPYFISEFGIENGLFIIAAISAVAIVLSLSLKELYIISSDKVKMKDTFSLSPINMLITVLAIAIDGVIVVTLASLFDTALLTPLELLTIVASYLFIKRLAMTGVSLVSGVVSLKVKSLHLFFIAVGFCILSLWLLALNFIALGVVIAFLANAVVVTFSPLIAIQQAYNKANTLQTISSISTWWDAGAALGAFLGIALIQYIGAFYLFASLALIITALFTNFIIQNGKTNRTII